MMTMNLTPLRRLLSAAAALLATGALCAAASAASTYSVSLKVPKSVKPGHSFKVTASGTSASTSRLTVFLSGKSCASSAKSEAGRAKKEIINKSVSHSYSSTKTATAGSTGSFHACAYLTTGSTTRAHASASYFVVLGGY
jgi:hypothetical protein